MWFSNNNNITFCSIPTAFEIGYYYTYCLEIEGIDKTIEENFKEIGLSIEQFFDANLANWTRFYPNLPYFYADFDTTILSYILALKKKQTDIHLKNFKIEEKISHFLEASRLNRTKEGWVQPIDYLKNIITTGFIEFSNVFYLSLIYSIGLEEPVIEENLLKWIKNSKKLTNDRYHNIDFIFFTLKRMTKIMEKENFELAQKFNVAILERAKKENIILTLKYEHLNPKNGVFKHVNKEYYLHFHKPHNPPMIERTTIQRLQKQLFDYYEENKVISEIELIDQLKGQNK